MTNAATDTDRLSKAFDLVCPAKRAAKRLAAGAITAVEAAAISWKDRIAGSFTQGALDAAGLTLDDVAAAVEFYTATPATISETRVIFAEYVAMPGAIAGQAVDAFTVRAAGYRAGPAGDH